MVVGLRDIPEVAALLARRDLHVGDERKDGKGWGTRTKVATNETSHEWPPSGAVY
jgi:hypothetical protein